MKKIETVLKILDKKHFLTISYHIFNGNTGEETIRVIENALINKNRPPLNDQNKQEYHFEKYGDIEVMCDGPRFTLLKKDNSIEQN